MRKQDIIGLGVPKHAVQSAFKGISGSRKLGLPVEDIPILIRTIVQNPKPFLNDLDWGSLADVLLNATPEPTFTERKDPAKYKKWGSDIDAGSIEQMDNACRLPVSVQGALMPDAHQGYGLPIGGVLATKNAVIPYAVGVDISCSMMLSVLDVPCGILESAPEKLKSAIDRETKFGQGAEFRKEERRNHKVLDDSWWVSSITRELKDTAWKQLGSSGAGNHFVNFGLLDLPVEDIGLKPGKYLALLSHSGSRGPGYKVATYFSRLAMGLHKELPNELKHLSWLDMDSAEGQEYWAAMQLMHRFAKANHECIHREIAKNLGTRVLAEVFNSHNLAWKETVNGEELIVHRKGATPAGRGVLGIIPGTMADPAYVVRGKGNEASLNSSSHGAGRKMSRTEAQKQFTWEQANKYIKNRGVTLLTAGLDEVPMAYKNIDEVMLAQADLVEKVAKFQPKMVKMAPDEGRRHRKNKKE